MGSSGCSVRVPRAIARLIAGHAFPLAATGNPAPC